MKLSKEGMLVSNWNYLLANAVVDTKDLPVSCTGLDVGVNTDEPIKLVNTTLPAPLLIKDSNFEVTAWPEGRPPTILTPNSIQEMEVNDSPAYVWPPATTGHMSLTPIDQQSPADTAELIEYVHVLENTRSIGVNPIPELLPLPLSRAGLPVIHVEAGAEYGVQTEQTGLNVEVNTDLSLAQNIDLVLPTPHVNEGIQTDDVMINASDLLGGPAFLLRHY
jgi:hypothetical protein